MILQYESGGPSGKGLWWVVKADGCPLGSWPSLHLAKGNEKNYNAKSFLFIVFEYTGGSTWAPQPVLVCGALVSDPHLQVWHPCDKMGRALSTLQGGYEWGNECEHSRRAELIL